MNNFGLILSVCKEDLEKIDDIPESFVFIKIQPHESLPLFDENSKLILYVSHGNKTLKGEGLIHKSELLPAYLAIRKYKNQTLFDSETLNDYVGARKEKKSLVLSVRNYKDFPEPIQIKFHLTMTGKLLSKEEYISLIKQ